MLDRKKVGMVARDMPLKDLAMGQQKTVEPRKKAVVASSMMKLLETNHQAANVVSAKTNNMNIKQGGKSTTSFFNAIKSGK